MRKKKKKCGGVKKTIKMRWWWCSEIHRNLVIAVEGNNRYVAK